MVSITAPYMIPLFLGMTYDARNSKPGIDIYDLKYVDDPVVTEFQQTKTAYSVVTNTEEINKALEIEGDMALKIKTGMMNLEGKGSYIKKHATAFERSGNSHHNLLHEIKVHFHWQGGVNVDESDLLSEMIDSRMNDSLKTDSFKADAKPRDGWESRYSPRALGTHYVSSVTHGCECIASLRFVANNASNLEEIKGIVTATVGTGGSGAELTAEGHLEKLQKSLEEKSSLEISYYCTVLLKSIPNSIDGLKKLMDSFPDLIKESNMTSGIPMSVELTPLGDISSEENRDKFAFLKNK
ncbi:uncharacterized protein CEXT_349391 [Caerostris extrusa]|uniref:Uncharacterized protein n=1 Tax=Caerostris extrusa TaxID=172846 RepID=A0AAV4XA69_CAEEX|nr:uncharacterized protein CEXT_349391 [Caerostris extrusa]